MKTANLDLRVERELLDRIDTWRNLHTIKPSRAAAVTFMLDGWLKEHGAARADQTRLTKGPLQLLDEPPAGR
jgi:hypothetical protein